LKPNFFEFKLENQIGVSIVQVFGEDFSWNLTVGWTLALRGGVASSKVDLSNFFYFRPGVPLKNVRIAILPNVLFGPAVGELDLTL